MRAVFSFQQSHLVLSLTFPLRLENNAERHRLSEIRQMSANPSESRALQRARAGTTLKRKRLRAERGSRGATLVTSNMPFDEWTSVFESERLTGALLDRLTHHVHILEMNGESFRLVTSKKAQRRSGQTLNPSPKTPAEGDAQIGPAS